MEAISEESQAKIKNNIMEQAKSVLDHLDDGDLLEAYSLMHILTTYTGQYLDATIPADVDAELAHTNEKA